MVATLMIALSGCESKVSTPSSRGPTSGSPREAPRSVAPLTSSTPFVPHVIRIPRGPEGVQYEEGPVTWGPSAVRAAADGSFWINDGVQSRLVHLGGEGKLLGTVSLGGQNVRPASFALAHDGFWVLDRAANTPALHHVGSDGSVRKTVPLSSALASDVFGLLDIEGQVFLQTLATRVVPISEATSYAGSTYAVEIAGEPLEVVENAHEGAETAEVTLRRGKVAATLRTRGRFLGMNLAQVRGRDLYFVLDAPAAGREDRIERNVFRIGENGDLVGRGRVALDEFYTHVDLPIAVQPDGDVYVLVTRKDGAELRRLEMAPP